MLQPRKDDLLAGFLNLACKKDLVQDSVNLLIGILAAIPIKMTNDSRTYLIEIKHQIQLTNIPKELVKNLHKEMYSLEIRQLVVICIDTDTKEQPCISPIYHLGTAFELNEIGLVFLIPGSNQTMDLCRCR